MFCPFLLLQSIPCSSSSYFLIHVKILKVTMIIITADADFSGKWLIMISAIRWRGESFPSSLTPECSVTIWPTFSVVIHTNMYCSTYTVANRWHTRHQLGQSCWLCLYQLSSRLHFRGDLWPSMPQACAHGWPSHPSVCVSVCVYADGSVSAHLWGSASLYQWCMISLSAWVCRCAPMDVHTPSLILSSWVSGLPA